MWAKSHEACRVCGTTSRPHKGGGMCTKCYRDEYMKDPDRAEAVRKKRRQYYERAGGADYSKVQRDRYYFSGMRERILARDNYRCRFCGVYGGANNTSSELIIHHKDEQGFAIKDSKKKNNSDDNLVSLCRACHAAEHARMNRLKKGVEFAVEYVINKVLRGAKRVSEGGSE